MLKVCNLHVNYGNFKALRGISLEMNKGEIVALLGSNGAGKTTTINTVSGITHLVQGEIYFKDENISGLTPNERAQKGIVQVPEGRKLFPYMTVMDNLLMGSYPKAARPYRKENLEMCFELFPKLYERRSQNAGLMSGGEQQMCAIARALMGHPELIMLDEPSLGLAPIVVENVFETIVKLHKMGMTILLVEQNVSLSLQIAQRGYVIETGQNAIEGLSEELLNNDKIREAYLGI